MDMLVNYIAVALSHVACNFASRCPPEGLFGCPLNHSQEDLVVDSTRYVRAMSRLVREEQCGFNLERLADAGDSWIPIFETIHLLPYSRLRDPVQDPDPLGRGAAACANSRPHPLVASRIDLPTSIRPFDPAPFLSGPSQVVLTDPDQSLLPMDLRPTPPPPGRLASREELLKLAARWDSIDKLALLKIDEVNPDDIADVFPVFKSETHDRQIID